MSYKVLKSKSVDEKWEIILADRGAGEYQRYVTWLRNKENPYERYSGHYFERIEDAERDFESRR